ncbi:thiol:disulfide interchange protein DsbA/DsbL [Roseateles sp. DB2]|uniref:thiol:disulfide interchange protein DsbA/DsbL n=1 Tax=Roseateles sp. DB2 TaxID=3453717 RepID=UPI003EF012CC
MQRRQFIIQGSAGLSALALPALGQAQSRPVEGKQYLRLGTPLSGTAAAGEVLEFFSYTCPHCHAFEPHLHQWLGRKPAKVQFRRVPLIINPIAKVTQKVYYALEAMGQLEPLHAKVFSAVQADLSKFQNLEGATAELVKLGVDGTRFKQMAESFGVQSKCQQANSLAPALGNHGVPTLVVNGRWVTSPSIAQGYPEVLATLDHLLTLPRA